MTLTKYSQKVRTRPAGRGVGAVVFLGLCIGLGSSLWTGASRATDPLKRPEEILSWRHQGLSVDEYTRLATEWDAYVRANPNDPRALVQWGNALRYAGKYDESWAAYTRAYQADSTDAAAIVAYVTHQWVNQTDDYDWHLDQTRLLRARDRDPDYPMTYYMLCLTAMRSGDRDLMNDCMTRVVRLGDMPAPLYDFGYNLLAGAPEGAILLTNGDNDTYPPWAVQAKESFRTDVRVVNLSLLNLHWYVRFVRDSGVPIPLSDSEIAALKWTKEQTISAAVQKALYAEVMKRGWRPPLLYAVTVPDWNQAAAGSRTLAGLLERIGPPAGEAKEAGEPSYDIGETRRLLDHVYKLDSITDPSIDWNRESELRKLAMNYVELLSRFGTSIEKDSPPGDEAPYLSRAIAIATFHRRLDVAQKILDDWQKAGKK
jgi:tetratricopeptide (TPR) repeat protein